MNPQNEKEWITKATTYAHLRHHKELRDVAPLSRFLEMYRGGFTPFDAVDSLLAICESG